MDKCARGMFSAGRNTCADHWLRVRNVPRVPFSILEREGGLLNRLVYISYNNLLGTYLQVV